MGLIRHSFASMPQPSNAAPQTDEHGFAPTKIVRARFGLGAPIRFFRVWIHTRNPRRQEERELMGEEHIRATGAYLRARRQVAPSTTPLPHQATPNFFPRATEEVGASPGGDHTHEGAKTSPDRDWPEDFGHENGNYLCHCHWCHRRFLGHKRRVSCRVCAQQQGYPKDAPRREEGQELHEQLHRTTEGGTEANNTPN